MISSLKWEELFSMQSLRRKLTLMHKFLLIKNVFLLTFSAYFFPLYLVGLILKNANGDKSNLISG